MKRMYVNSILLFDELGVDLVLSGHDHIYSRTEMYNGEKVTDGQQGTMYIVGGCSSGSKFYDADSNGRPWQDVVYDENNPVFSVLKTADGKLYFGSICYGKRRNQND